MRRNDYGKTQSSSGSWCQLFVNLPDGITAGHPAFSAGITAANGNTQVVIKPGNVPVVNIATPNSAGISHNTYKEFNVGAPGAVLNNSIKSGKSQLGVDIINATGNPKLNGRPAELIINEVIGGNRSELKGKLEVFGNKANVMIANPNGITCDGCGFINTPGVTLTTGKPQFDKQGALEALTVKKGTVTIGGKGLDGNAQDYVDIISRATTLNGKINAQSLSLTQGANQVSFKDGTIKAIAGEGAKPQLAVDTKALGGMYANKIRLVANEDGVGVNLKDLTSKQHDITLSANGKISLGGVTHSKTDLNVSAKALHVAPGALVQADGDATLAATSLVNNGQTSTSGDMRIFSEDVHNIGDQAKLHANKKLWIQKDAQGNKSKLVENRSATIKTNSGDLVIRTERLDNVVNEFAMEERADSADTIGMHLFGEVYDAHKAGDIRDRKDYYQDNSSETQDYISSLCTGWECLAVLYTLDDVWINDSSKKIFVRGISAPGRVDSGANLYVNASSLHNDLSEIHAKKDIFLTGDNLFVKSQDVGSLRSFARFTPDNDTYQKYKEMEWILPPPSFIRTGSTAQSWVHEGGINSVLTAGGNLVADFNQSLTLDRPLPYDFNAVSEVGITQRSDIITAKNVLLHGKTLYIGDNIKASENISLLADDSIKTAAMTMQAGQNVSVTAPQNIELWQSELKGKDVTILSRQGDILSHSSEFPNFFHPDGARWLGSLEASGDLTLNAGKSITLRNTLLAPMSRDVAMTANGSIAIVKNSAVLDQQRFGGKIPQEKQQENFNRLLPMGALNASGSVLLNSGGYLALRGVQINAGKDVTLLAGHNADLNYRELDGSLDHLFPSSRTPELGSKVHAGGNLLINSARDLGTQGGTFLADGNITLLAGQNLWLAALGYSAIDADNDNNKDDRHLITTFSAGNNLTAAANNQLLAYGAKLTSDNNMTLTSGGNMRFEAVQNHTYREGGNEFTESTTQQGSELNAGGLMTLISNGSILFQATKLLVKGVSANWRKPIAMTDWGARIATIEQQLNDTQQRIQQAQQDKAGAERRLAEREAAVRQAEAAVKNAEDRRDEFISNNPPHEFGRGWSTEVASWDKFVAQRQGELNAARGAVDTAKGEVSQALDRVNQVGRERDDAQNRLSSVREEAVRKGADEARLKADIDAYNQAEAMRAGNMDIAAKGGYLYAQAMEESNHFEKKETKRKWYGKKKEIKQVRHDVVNKVTEFTAAGNINLLSHDDSTYEASKIAAGQHAKLTSTHGSVNFRAVKDTSFEQSISSSKGFFIKQANKGYTDTHWVLPSVYTGGTLTVDAAQGVNADIKVQNGQVLQSAINALGNTPGSSWVKNLNQRNDVQWAQVKDAYDSWDYKSQSLNPAVAAVIAIAAAAVTAGSSLVATAASSTAATVGGGAVTSGAVTAGMSSLASQVAVALVENQGNLSKTLRALGNSQTVKATATAMAIGGALNGFDSAMGWSKDAAGNSLNPKDVKLPQLSNGDWSKVAQRVAGQSVISSSLNTTINGGSFKDSLTNALLANVGSQINAEGAKLIGDNGEVLGIAGKSVSHAVVAGVAAEIGRGDGKGAAAGALAAELAGVIMQSSLFEPANLNAKERQLLRLQEALNGNEAKEQTARVLGASTGALTTHTPEGAYSAADSAQTVYRYNMTEHMLQQYALDNQRDILAADKGDKEAAKRVVARREAAAAVAVVGGGGLALTAGGFTLLGAAPEMLLAARLAIAGCKTNPALCLNQAGIYAADIVAPDAIIGTGAVTAGSTLIVGKTQDSVKKLAQQVVKVTDESFKNKAFNTQPVAEFIKGESTAGSGLSTKTVDYLRDIQKTNTDKLVMDYDSNELKVFEKQFERMLREGGSAGKGTKLELEPKKFDYLYGKVTSGTHNTDRSTQLAQVMRRLGLQTDESGTKVLTEHLNKVVNTKGNVIDTYTKGSQKFEIRESLLMGPSGKATKLETSFEIMPDGSRRFVTTIPKEGKK